MRPLVGDPRLKKYASGAMFKNVKIGTYERAIYLAYTRKERVSNISEKFNVSTGELSLTLRKVGGFYQDYYLKTGGKIESKDKRVFNDFVRGVKVNEMVKKWSVTHKQLDGILRIVGKFYLVYFKHNSEKFNYS
jgi:hypothetical protein